MLYVLITFWFLRELKHLLFWLYLWQLKEYHIGRFLNHFETHVGKKLLLDFSRFLKLGLFVFLLLDDFFIYVYYALFLIYFAEFISFVSGIRNKSLKKPVWTKKTFFLFWLCFLVLILFLSRIYLLPNRPQVLWILGFDILTPLIFSSVALFFQPASALLRNRVLRKAKEKMEKILPVSGLKVVAITGSYGKTSTKEFLTTILSKKFKVLSTSEHQNSEIAVARSVLEKLKPSHEIFIAEVGAYNKGKIKEVCEMLKPRIGLVTGVNEQHLALFGSFANLLSAEGGGELAELLPKNGLLVVNGDNKYCLELLKKSDNLPPEHEKIYSLDGRNMNTDIWAEEVEVRRDSVLFIVADKKGNLAHFNASVLGRKKAKNFLGAILIANELGMSFEEISEAVRSIKQEQAGMVLRQGKHGLNIIDSSYSANPTGVMADLDYLSIFAGKRVVVMPSLIELGKKSSEIHEKIGQKIAEVCDLAIITSKDKFKEIEKGFNQDILRRSQANVAKCLLCDNPRDIFSAITAFCKSGDAVLLEGRVPKELLNLLIEK